MDPDSLWEETELEVQQLCCLDQDLETELWLDLLTEKPLWPPLEQERLSPPLDWKQPEWPAKSSTPSQSSLKPNKFSPSQQSPERSFLNLSSLRELFLNLSLDKESSRLQLSERKSFLDQFTPKERPKTPLSMREQFKEAFQFRSQEMSLSENSTFNQLYRLLLKD